MKFPLSITSEFHLLKLVDMALIVPYGFKLP